MIHQFSLALRGCLNLIGKVSVYSWFSAFPDITLGRVTQISGCFSLQCWLRLPSEPQDFQQLFTQHLQNLQISWAVLLNLLFLSACFSQELQPSSSLVRVMGTSQRLRRVMSWFFSSTNYLTWEVSAILARQRRTYSWQQVSSWVELGLIEHRWVHVELLIELQVEVIHIFQLNCIFGFMNKLVNIKHAPILANFYKCMSSSEAQKERILKLNTKDKKLTRLFSYTDLSDRDALFLNSVYNEKQQLYFKYAIIISIITMASVKMTVFRMSKGFTTYAAMLGTGFASHLYWSSVINKRFNRFVDPYYQKYGIK